MSNKINKLIIDSTQSIIELCILGAKHRTDKFQLSSPIADYVHNPIEYEHSYTAIYDLFFQYLNIKKLN